MPRSTRFSLLLLFTLLPTLLPNRVAAQSRMSPETLKKLKAATVYLEMFNGNKPLGSGSGFVIGRGKDEGTGREYAVIVTNEHVAMPDRIGVVIRCVFHSGSPKPIMGLGMVQAVDRSNDLAILKCLLPAGQNVPEPIDIEADVEIMETLPVYALGFPFGDLLAASSTRSPAITISKGTISSIRRDDLGRVAVVQVDSGINPGNSGGPVVTEEGRLIGIAVAKISGTDIGLAIPKALLLELLQGSAQTLEIASQSYENGFHRFYLTVTLNDPNENVRSVRVQGASMRHRPNEKFHLKRDEKGNWQSILPGLDQTELKIKRSNDPRSYGISRANGRVEIGPLNKGDVFHLQVLWERKNGEIAYGAPIAFVAGKAHGGVCPIYDLETRSLIQKQRGSMGESGVARSRPAPRGPLPGMPADDNVHFESFDATITDVKLGGGGRYLVLHLGSDDQAVIYDVQERRKVGTIAAMGEDVIAANQEYAYVFSRVDRKFQRWTLATATRDRRGKVAVDGTIMAVASGSASKGQMLVCWVGRSGNRAQLVYSLLTPGSSRTILINARPTRRQKKAYAIPLRHVDPRIIVGLSASADGKVYGIWAENASPSGLEILRLRKGERASLVAQPSRNVGYVMPSADGRWICTGEGVFSVDLVRQRSKTISIASTHPKFFFRIGEDGFSICDTSTGDVVTDSPPLTEFGEDIEALRRSRLGLEERILLVPQYNALVTVPPGDDRIAIHEVSLGVGATGGLAAGLAFTDQPYRTWTDRTGKYQVEARLVMVGETQITIERRDGRKVTVPIDRLSESDARYVAELE